MKHLMMEKVALFNFFILSVFYSFFFLSISSENELENVLCLLFLDFLFYLSTCLLGEGFAAFTLPTTFAAGSSGESPALTTFFPPCFIIWVHYRDNKDWLTMIFLFKIIIWIIFWPSRDIFESFWSYKFSQNTNNKSSTVRFTNKAERWWQKWW